MKNMKFRYFKDVFKNAIFTDAECDICGTKKNCLEGEYFSDSGKYNSVCLNCLISGLAKVEIPNYIVESLKVKIINSKELLANEDIEENVKLKIKELEANPPVPWIQYNNWPICCNDFACYIGEWTQEEFIAQSNNDNYINFFKSILDDSTKSKIDDINILWEDIGHNTAAFVFQCLICGKYIVVCQSY